MWAALLELRIDATADPEVQILRGELRSQLGVFQTRAEARWHLSVLTDQSRSLISQPRDAAMEVHQAVVGEEEAYRHVTPLPIELIDEVVLDSVERRPESSSLTTRNAQWTRAR